MDSSALQVRLLRAPQVAQTMTHHLIFADMLQQVPG